MAASQDGTGSLDVGGQRALAAIFIDIPANAIVESVTVNPGGAPQYEDILDEDGAFHTRFTYHAGGSIAFTGGGTGEPLPGCLLTGATSGASAYLVAVELDSGTWAGGDAAGTIVLSGLTGGTAFQAENLNASGSVTQDNIATIGAALSLIGMHGATIVLVGAAYTTAAGDVDGVATTEQYYIESASAETSKGPVRTTLNLTLLPTEIA